MPNKLDPYFGDFTASPTADAENSISIIKKEVSGLFWSAKILEQLKNPSASLMRTDLRKLAVQMRETADALDKVVDRCERVNLCDFVAAAE